MPLLLKSKIIICRKIGDFLNLELILFDIVSFHIEKPLKVQSHNVGLTLVDILGSICTSNYALC